MLQFPFAVVVLLAQSILSLSIQPAQTRRSDQPIQINRTTQSHQVSSANQAGQVQRIDKIDPVSPTSPVTSGGFQTAQQGQLIQQNQGSQKRQASQEGGWQEVFASQGWYKNLEGQQKEFSGVLERIPHANQPSTLQRTSYYRLGKRTVFTRGKKVPLLEKMVAKGVQIRGKVYKIELEGKQLNEIWPAAVRLSPKDLPR